MPKPSDHSNPCFIDCEASSFRDASYPIEIAWSDSLSAVESYLVRPAPDWVDWDDYAEREIHHITRDLRFVEGHPASEIATRMNEALGGMTDAPEFDGHWIGRVYEAAGLEPAFSLAKAYSLTPPQPSREAAGENRGTSLPALTATSATLSPGNP